MALVNGTSRSGVLPGGLAVRRRARALRALDKAIKTMRDTGADMKVKYKATSRGGLAVNVVEC